MAQQAAPHARALQRRLDRERAEQDGRCGADADRPEAQRAEQPAV